MLVRHMIVTVTVEIGEEIPTRCIRHVDRLSAHFAHRLAFANVRRENKIT